MLDTINHKNILLNQILFTDETSYSIREVLPSSKDNESIQSLSRDRTGNIFWIHIDNSLNLLVNNRFINTNIYYDNGRIGLNRSPLFNYKVDIAVPKNTLMTAFHIGDGSFGFSMGNGTTEGFVPEIVGIGSDENDAGLYFVGIAGNDISSNIPLIIIDGRNTFNDTLTNRPILGITSGNYNEYKLLINAKGNLIIDGTITTNDIILENQSLKTIITNLKKEIEILKNKLS